MAVADGYYNNTFVGTWKEYKTGKILKCIWGDGRLPYCFDFDGGAGELIPNDKYVANGWLGYPDNDFIYSDKCKCYLLKDKWWLK
jgi:hypothetical protein